MRTAPDKPEDQGVQTTPRHVLPAEPKERIAPEFWLYLESLKPSDWDRHILYLYRVEPSPSIPLGKSSGSIQMPNGQQVSWCDKEEAELALAQKYGGGVFRAILKRGPERVTESRIYIGATPRPLAPFVEVGGAGPTVSPISDPSSTGQVAKPMPSHDREAVDIAVTGLKGASEVLTQLSQLRKPEQSTSLVNDEIMRALITRALNPPDPFETLTKLLGITRELGLGGANPTRAADPLVENILKTAVERLMQPPPSTGTISASTELMRQLPSVAGYVTEAMREWRAGMEAQRDAAAIMRGTVRQPAPQPALPPAPVNHNPAPPPPNSPAPDATGAPSLEFVESKVVAIIKEPISADEAADRTLSFLEELDPQLVGQLVSLGETGMLGLFQQRPVLKQVTQNMPRLLEFIKAFLKQAAEDEQPPPAKPN